jgi:predicted Zn-dependent protease
VIEVCGHVSDQLASEYERTSLRTALLELALELDASDEATLERFASLVNDDRVGQKVRMFLETRSAELPANVHAALGVAACARGDFVGARPHFAKVIDAHPDVPEAYNNLAWVLINAEPIDAEQALVLATRAVELSPDSAAFRETRGQVLVKLERWQEAVVDLERALNGLPSEAGIHDSLAKAYEALGKLEQAQQHRGLALSGGQAFALPSIP